MFAGFGCPSFWVVFFFYETRVSKLASKRIRMRCCSAKRYRRSDNITIWSTKLLLVGSSKHPCESHGVYGLSQDTVPQKIHSAAAQGHVWNRRKGTLMDSESGDSEDPFWHTLGTILRQLLALPELELQLLPGLKVSLSALHVSARYNEKKLIVKSRSILRKPVYTVKWRFPKIGLPLVSIQFHGMFRRKNKNAIGVSAVSSFMKAPNIILQPLLLGRLKAIIPTDQKRGPPCHPEKSPRTRQARRRRRKWPGYAWSSIAFCIPSGNLT